MVECANWRSRTGKQLQYTVTHLASPYPVVLYSGPQERSQVVLGVGNHTVRVVVEDTSGRLVVTFG